MKADLSIYLSYITRELPEATLSGVIKGHLINAYYYDILRQENTSFKLSEISSCNQL